MSKRLMWLIPTGFLLLICCLGYWSAEPGLWHSEISNFWEKQSWHEIKSLAENLDRTGRADSETLYLAARASSILQDHAAKAHFSSRFLEKRVLDWDAEVWLQENYKPNQLLERFRIYRTRAIATILSILTLFNLIVLWKGWNLLPWSGLLSIVGITIALV